MTKVHYVFMLASLLLVVLIIFGPLIYFSVASGDAGFYKKTHHMGKRVSVDGAFYIYLNDKVVTSISIVKWDIDYNYREYIVSIRNGEYTDLNENVLKVHEGKQLLVSVKGLNAIYTRSRDPIGAWYMVYACWSKKR